jgi:hypothetical protein
MARRVVKFNRAIDYGKRFFSKNPEHQSGGSLTDEARRKLENAKHRLEVDGGNIPAFEAGIREAKMNKPIERRNPAACGGLGVDKTPSLVENLIVSARTANSLEITSCESVCLPNSRFTHGKFSTAQRDFQSRIGGSDSLNVLPLRCFGDARAGKVGRL